METFIAKKKAEDLEKQLREIIIYTRGMGGWQELIRMRADISRKRKEEEKLARMKFEKNVEYAAIAFLSLLIIAALSWLGWLFVQSRY